MKEDQLRVSLKNLLYKSVSDLNRKLSIILCLFLLFACPVNADELALWQKWMPITFSGYTPPDGNAETLIDFPVLVVLKETEEGAGFSYDDFLSPPYNDLRFTADDKKTLLDFEVDLWNPDGDSFVWVRVPELTAETSIYACWKSGGAELPVCTSDGSVWEENFKGVWHMNDGLDPLTVQKSTANDITGIKLAMGLPAQVTGILGNAQ